MKTVITTIFALLLTLPTFAAEPSAFDTYKKGEYLQTVEQLQRTLSEQGASSSLYYDLGNAYSKAGNPGAAVLNYEKALRLNPGNADARNNLRYTDNLVQLSNEALAGERNLDPSPAPLSFTDSIRHYISRVSPNGWAVFSIVLFFLFIAGAVLYLFFAGVKVRKIGFFGGAICLLFSVIGYGFACLARTDATSGTCAVLMQSEASLLADPKEDAKPVAAPLSSGTKLQVMGTEKAKDGTLWTRLYLNADYTGWMPTAYIETITLPSLH